MSTDWVKAYYANIDAMDMKETLAGLTDDVKFRFGSNPTTTGKEAVEQGLSQLWSALESMSHNMTGVWESGNVTIIEADVTCIRKDGKVVVLPVATIWRREGNLINDFRVNMDINPLFV